MTIRSAQARAIDDRRPMPPPISEEPVSEPIIALCRSVESKNKRAFDICAATFLLMMLLPILLIVAIWVKLDSDGPILFRQRRTGLDGKQFTILKYRTMVVVEDGAEVRQARRGDDRITRIGAILRRTSLDELPQLFNVIAGDMSLVGPRPHALAHDAIYGASIPEYRLRFRCRPGLTGLAQISGLRGEVRGLSCMQRRVEADNYYIDNWSVLLDLRIICATVPKMIYDPKAY